MRKINFAILCLMIAACNSFSQNPNWVYIADTTSITNNVSLTSDNQLLISRVHGGPNSVARLNLDGVLLWEENVCSCPNSDILISAEAVSGELIHLTVRGNLYKTNNLGIESVSLGNVIPQITNPYIRNVEISNGHLYFAGRGQLNGEQNLFRGEINLNDLDVTVNVEQSNLRYNSFSIDATNNLWFEVLSNGDLHFISIYNGMSSTLIDSFSLDSFNEDRISDIAYLDDDNIILIGYKDLDYLNWKGVIRSINSVGQENYFREYQGSAGNANILFWKTEILDDRILVGGSNGGALYLAEIDLSGEIIGDYKNDLSTANDDVVSIQKGANNDIILAGTINASDIIDPLRSYILSISDLVLGNKEQEPGNLVVYPNPGTSEITVLSDQERIVKIELYSMSGNKLLENSENNMSIGHLANGIYILKIYLDEGYITQKIMKSN